MPECINCGYDLRAHRVGDECPECGYVLEESPVPLPPRKVCGLTALAGAFVLPLASAFPIYGTPSLSVLAATALWFAAQAVVAVKQTRGRDRSYWTSLYGAMLAGLPMLITTALLAAGLLFQAWEPWDRRAGLLLFGSLAGIPFGLITLALPPHDAPYVSSYAMPLTAIIGSIAAHISTMHYFSWLT